MGHVSPAMMKTYSHIRRKALDSAAQALEPTFKLMFPKPAPRPREKGRFVQVTSQSKSHVTVTSPAPALTSEDRKNIGEIGSSGWTRTSNPPVNRFNPEILHQRRLCEFEQ